MSEYFETPAAALEFFMQFGAFETHLEEYLNDQFRYNPHGDGFWYTENLRKQGLAVAEQKLAEYVQARHLDVFSSVVKPIAEGLIAVAKTRPKSIIDVTQHALQHYPLFYTKGLPYAKLIFFNEDLPGLGCGCRDVPETLVFRSRGALDLKAIILEAGVPVSRLKVHQTLSAKLTLVFPVWEKLGDPIQRIGFSTIAIESSGEFRESTLRPRDEDGKSIDPVSYLKDLNGIETTQRGRSLYSQHHPEGSSSNVLGSALGFPGAASYFVSNIGELGGYLNHLAGAHATHAPALA